jgi:hypothetical protein
MYVRENVPPATSRLVQQLSLPLPPGAQLVSPNPLVEQLLAAHWPPLHAPVAHFAPHAPQLFGSVLSLTQLDPHEVRPLLHWHVPLPSHDAPLPHAPHAIMFPHPSGTVPQVLVPHDPEGTQPQTPGVTAPHV